MRVMNEVTVQQRRHILHLQAENGWEKMTGKYGGDRVIGLSFTPNFWRRLISSECPNYSTISSLSMGDSKIIYQSDTILIIPPYKF